MGKNGEVRPRSSVAAEGGTLFRTPTAEELREVLAHHGGNVARVASFFGRDRRQVCRWIERYGLDVETHRD